MKAKSKSKKPLGPPEGFESRATIGKELIKLIEGTVVRFTPVELIAGYGDFNEWVEVLRTARGAIIWWDQSAGEYDVFKDLDALKEHLLERMQYDRNRSVFEQLGGNVREEITEI